jgi:predicted nucleic-acid-binding protein
VKKKGSKPEYRREERVKKLQNSKGMSKKEAEEVVDTVIRTKEQEIWQLSPDARIHISSKGEAHFQQGDIMFPVDAKDLNKVVGGNGNPSALDKLMDSQIVSLATANGLPVSPFARDLVRKPLIGLLQLVWYRDVEKHESEHLKKNQEKRVAEYREQLSEYKEEPVRGEGRKASRPRATEKWAHAYKLANAKAAVADGREAQVFEVVKKLKEATFTDIVKAAEGKVKTKQDLTRIVARFLKNLVSSGAIQEVK